MSMIPDVALGGVMSSLQSIAITAQWCTGKKRGEEISREGRPEETWIMTTHTPNPLPCRCVISSSSEYYWTMFAIIRGIHSAICWGLLSMEVMDVTLEGTWSAIFSLLSFPCVKSNTCKVFLWISLWAWNTVKETKCFCNTGSLQKENCLENCIETKINILKGVSET